MCAHSVVPLLLDEAKPQRNAGRPCLSMLANRAQHTGVHQVHNRHPFKSSLRGPSQRRVPQKCYSYEYDRGDHLDIGRHCAGSPLHVAQHAVTYRFE